MSEAMPLRILHVLNCSKASFHQSMPSNLHLVYMVAHHKTNYSNYNFIV